MISKIFHQEKVLSVKYILNNKQMGKSKRIKKGHYLYKGYEIKCHGYYQPDGCVYWEAINPITDCADFHAKTKSLIMFLIDESEKEDAKRNNNNICGNCDAFCKCSLENNGAKHDDPACEYFYDTVLRQL